MNYNEVLNDIYYHFHFYIYLTKEDEEGKEVKRYISEVGYISSSGEYTPIYLNDGEKEEYQPLPSEALRFFKKSVNDELFNKYFVKGEVNE